MSNNATVVPPGDWRVLILDTTDRDDPMWLVCHVGEVRPAGQEALGDEVAVRWVTSREGRRVSLVPLKAKAWRIDAVDTE